MKFTHDWHCVHGIFYNLVLVVAYRRSVLTEKIQKRCIEIIRDLSPNFGIEILEVNGEADHLHLLLKAKPHTALSKFVNSVKTVTSRYLKREFPEIQEQLWTPKFWSRSYFVATTGGVPLDKVQAYIQQQRKWT